MLYATHLVSLLHPEPAWIDPSGVVKYTSSTYAIIFFCPKHWKQRFGSVLLFFDCHVTHWSSVLESYPSMFSNVVAQFVNLQPQFAVVGVLNINLASCC